MKEKSNFQITSDVIDECLEGLEDPKNEKRKEETSPTSSR